MPTAKRQAPGAEILCEAGCHCKQCSFERWVKKMPVFLEKLELMQHSMLRLLMSSCEMSEMRAVSLEVCPDQPHVSETAGTILGKESKKQPSN